MNIDSITENDDGSATIVVYTSQEELHRFAAEAIKARLIRAAKDYVEEDKEPRLRDALVKAKIAYSEMRHKGKLVRAGLVAAVEALSHVIATDSVHPSKLALVKEARDRGSKILWDAPNDPS